MGDIHLLLSHLLHPPYTASIHCWLSGGRNSGARGRNAGAEGRNAGAGGSAGAGGRNAGAGGRNAGAGGSAGAGGRNAGAGGRNAADMPVLGVSLVLGVTLVPRALLSSVV